MNPKKMWVALLALTLAMGVMTGCGKESEKSGSAKKPEAVKKPEKPEKKLPPMHAAIAKNDMAAIKSLLEKGTDVNVKDDDGNTPLHVAAEKNNVDVAKLLLDKGAKQRKNKAGDNPLHIAAARGSADIVNLLLDRGAKPNVQNADGETPLHLAAIKDSNVSNVIAKSLLKHGASLKTQNEMKQTPIEYALINHCFQIAHLLLKEGATVSYEYYVDLAIRKHDHDLLRFMTSISWNGISPGTDSRTCLRAVFSNDTEAVKILFPAVARRQRHRYVTGEIGEIGKTMLVEAAGNGNTEICRLIIEEFSDTMKENLNIGYIGGVKVPYEFSHHIKEQGGDFYSNWYKSNDKHELTPLIAACETKHFDCAKLLIKNGADVNQAVNEDGGIMMTALYYAVKDGDINFVKYLLSKGAKVGKGLVKLTKNEDIIELLDGAE